MNSKTRRFILLGSLSLSSWALAGCGGGAGGDAPAVASAPSNPGAHIVYSRNVSQDLADIYVIREDGSGDKPLANETDPEGFWAVTADNRVIYERYVGGYLGQRDLYSVKIDGTDRKVLSATPENDMFYGMTPGGKIVFYTYTTQTGADINAVNADGTQLVTLANASGNEYIEGITASGRVIYSYNDGVSDSLNSVNADGTGRVTYGVPANSYGCSYGGAAKGKVALVCSFDTATNDVYTTSEAGGVLTPLATDAAANEVVQMVTKSGHLVIAKRPANGDQDNLYLANVDGGPLVPIATSSFHEYGIGSTTDRLLYYVLTAPSTGNGDAMSVKVDGSGAVPLKTSADPASLYFITPAEKLIFQRNSAGTKTDLYGINPDGTGVVTLANSSNDEYFKAGDSNRIVYSSYSGGSTSEALYSVSIATSVSTQLVAAGSDLYFAGSTPSGKVVLRKGGNSSNPNGDVYIVGADGSGLRSLASTSNSEFFVGVAP